jgi:hypothetical protein
VRNDLIRDTRGVDLEALELGDHWGRRTGLSLVVDLVLATVFVDADRQRPDAELRFERPVVLEIGSQVAAAELVASPMLSGNRSELVEHRKN